MVVKALLLDLDGTLADSRTLLYKSYSSLVVSFGKNPTEVEFDGLDGFRIRDAIIKLCAIHEVNADIKNLTARYISELANLYLDCPIAEGGQDLLNQANKHGVPVAIVTSATRDFAERWLLSKGIRGDVSVLVTEEDVEHTKPHPDAYLLAAKILQIPTSLCIAVDDSTAGIESACRAGCITFGLNISPRATLSPELTFKFLNSLSDVTRFMIETLNVH